MNPVLRNMMDSIADKINHETTDGIVKGAFETIPTYLDDIIRSSIKSLHESVPLEYLGYQFIDPEDEFNMIYRGGNGKIPFDLSHSDVFPIKFLFKYDDEVFENRMLLPYAKQGNIMTISGTKYVIEPVLSDTVISPDNNQVFVRLLRDKLTFKSYSANFLLNGERIEGLVIWVDIIKRGSKSGELGRPLNAIAIYLLGVLGFYGCIDKYVRKNVQPMMDRKFELSDMMMVKAEPDVLSKYSEDYDIYEATGVRPSKVKTQGQYIPHNIAILVKKDVPKTSFLSNFIFGILETFSTLPQDAQEVLELVNAKNPNVEDEIFKWRMIFGTIAHKGNYSPRKVAESITMHFDSVEYYIDTIIYKQLQAKNMEISTFYDLIYEMLNNFIEWTRSAKTYNSDIRNQYLDINYYICYGIISAFNTVIHDINRRRQRSRNLNRTIKINEIVRMFDAKWKSTQIYKIVKSDSPNFNIATPDYSGDLKYPKCTSLVELQGCGEGIKRPKDNRFPYAAQFISGTDLIFGSILSLTKKKCSPKFKLNCYCVVDRAGKIVIPEFDMKTVEYVDSHLRSRGGSGQDLQDVVLLDDNSETEE